MLDPEFKEKWCMALESGKYSQTSSMLYDGQSYCCLGVACVVLGATFVPKNDDYDDDAVSYRPMLNDVDLGGGTDEAFDYEGLKASGLTQQEQETLYNMNDRGTDFKVIADYIRNNL